MARKMGRGLKQLSKNAKKQAKIWPVRNESSRAAWLVAGFCQFGHGRSDFAVNTTPPCSLP
jgi:hypothetical protein